MRNPILALVFAVAVAGPVASQACSSAPQVLRTYDPWQASFFYGWTYGMSLNLVFDLDVQVPVTVNEFWMTTYDQGLGAPATPNQVGNIAEARVYMIPGSWAGQTASPAAWGVASPASGQPEVFADLTVVPWSGTSPVDNFRDASGNPAVLTLQPGQYGVCIEVLPTSYAGTPLVLQNPGRLHTIGVAPNPGLTWSDGRLAISNDGIMSNGWYSVDASGALVPNPTPSSPIDSINLGIDYTLSPTAAAWQRVGEGCYDRPRMIYELLAANATAIALVNTSWSFTFVPDPFGGYYQLAAGGPAYDGVTPAANGVDLATQPFTLSTTASWDDASLVLPLSAATFPSGFPYPGGTCTDVTVNSNGKVYLGVMTLPSGSAHGASYGSTAAFRDLNAQHAPFHTDLDVTTGGAIYLEDPSPNGGIRLTWHDVPNWNHSGTSNRIQLELLPNGDVTWAFGGSLANQGAGNDALTGFSGGNGDPLSTPVVWSAITSVTTGNGSSAPALSLSARPIVGTGVEFVVGDLQPATATPIGGLLSVAVAGAAPPVPLQPFGMPGCFGHVDLGAVMFTTLLANPASTDMRWAWNVPAAAQGLTIHAQAATFTPNPLNAPGILVTNGICVRAGQ